MLKVLQVKQSRLHAQLQQVQHLTVAAGITFSFSAFCCTFAGMLGKTVLLHDSVSICFTFESIIFSYTEELMVDLMTAAYLGHVAVY